MFANRILMFDPSKFLCENFTASLINYVDYQLNVTNSSILIKEGSSNKIVMSMRWTLPASQHAGNREFGTYGRGFAAELWLSGVSDLSSDGT